MNIHEYSLGVLPGFVSELNAAYMMPVGGAAPEGQLDLGDIQVDWSVTGDPIHIRQFDVSWHCLATGGVQRKCVAAPLRSATIPVTSTR